MGCLTESMQELLGLRNSALSAPADRHERDLWLEVPDGTDRFLSDDERLRWAMAPIYSRRRRRLWPVA